MAGFGFDPDVPAGFQDADLETRELEDAAARLCADCGADVDGNDPHAPGCPRSFAFATREEVAAAAEQQHADHPQYRGHWDGDEWQPVRLTRRVTTKMGVAFEAGDVTLARWTPDTDDTVATAYSFRNRVDTSVRYTDVEVVR